MNRRITLAIRLLPLLACLLALPARGGAQSADAAVQPASVALLPEAQVDGQGIFLSQILAGPLPPAWAGIRVANAPAFSTVGSLTRAQVIEALKQMAPEWGGLHWTGAERVRIMRRARTLEDGELREMILETLQREHVKDRGELELRFTRPWSPISIPDEPVTLKIIDLPMAGVTPNFILRFELRAGTELLGNWQMAVQARILREVWVTGSPLFRGQLLKDADLTLERRDVLVMRDAITALPAGDLILELAENLPSGVPLTSRSFRARPVVQRGKIVEAVVQDGSLSISAKVEVLEDGLPGQFVRVRNVKSRREFRGKVQNENTILVNL